MQKTTQQRITDILQELLGVDPSQVTPSANIIEDLGADSLDCVEIVMACEDEFPVEIYVEEAEKVVTVEDLVRLIESKLNQKS